MSGVIAGSVAIYVPKELPSQDRRFLERATLERKVAGEQVIKSEGYKLPSERDYTNK